jgi:hypothetical protein
MPQIDTLIWRELIINYWRAFPSHRQHSYIAVLSLQIRTGRTGRTDRTDRTARTDGTARAARAG